MKYILLAFICIGCNSIPTKNIVLHPTALKQEEKTYVISDKTISLPDGSFVEITKNKETPFGSWFVVHEDYVKEHNENQNDLIKSFEDQIRLKKSLEYWRIGCISLIISTVLIFLKDRRRI